MIRDTWATSSNPVKVELFYSGDWHDITGDLADEGVTITRGRADEGALADPQSASFTLTNTTGTYSPRNPLSPLYGLVGRNTPVRISAYLAGAWWPRFTGEVVSWPQTWGLTGAPSVVAKVECAGVMRRLGQGKTPVKSVLNRAIRALGADLVAYWPCEDGAGATTLGVLRGTKPASIVGAATAAGYDGFAASLPIPTFTTGRATFPVDAYTATSTWQVRALVNVSSSCADTAVLMSIHHRGSANRTDLVYGAGGAITVKAYKPDGSLLGSAGPVALALDGRDLLLSADARISGGHLRVIVAVVEPGATTGDTFDYDLGADTAVGAVSSVVVNPNGADLGGSAFGHVTVEKATTTVYAYGTLLNGRAGEPASLRLLRLCDEEGVPIAWVGEDGTSQPMGPQRAGTLLELLTEAAETAGGILVERRSSPGLYWYPLSALYAQQFPVTIPYSDNLLIPFEPVDDDQLTRNRVTVTRAGGGTATVEDATSPMGTQAPPLGVGVYDESVTLSLGSDHQAAAQAAFRVALGTVNEARYPRIGVNLAHPRFKGDAALTGAILGASVGSPLTVTDLPPWLPPGPVSGMIRGYTERITPADYTITMNCTPFAPYRTTTYGGDTARWNNNTTVLASAATAATATLVVAFTAGPPWSSSSGPFDVMVAGERVTVTAVAGSGSPQTFTVTRAVNGVSKALPAGAAVTIADSPVYGL